MAQTLDGIYVGGMTTTLPVPAQLLERRATFDAPLCAGCGQPYYPEVLRSPAAEDYDCGQARRHICDPCRRRRYMELDLIAAARAGLVRH